MHACNDILYELAKYEIVQDQFIRPRKFKMPCVNCVVRQIRQSVMP